jgi:hypothetical protein
VKFLVKQKGEKYECEECGLVVVVEDPCGCPDECQIVCCSQPMKPVKEAKAAKAAPKTAKAPSKAKESKKPAKPAKAKK